MASIEDMLKDKNKDVKSLFYGLKNSESVKENLQIKKNEKLKNDDKSKKSYGDSNRKTDNINNRPNGKHSTNLTYNKDNKENEKTEYNSVSKKSKVQPNGSLFVNPYNFVSLGEEANKNRVNKEKESNLSDKELLTGVINCVLKTKTPIFIPNITNDNAFEKAKITNEKNVEQENKVDESKQRNEKHKNYDFFSYDDLSGKNTENDPKEPIIPGSSIRGVIRSTFEALTNSCMMTYDKPVTLRETEPKNPGILEYVDGTWKLYEAKKLMIKTGKCNRDEESQYIIEKDENNKKYIIVNRKRIYTGDEIMFDEGEEYRKNIPYKLAKNIGTGDSTGILLLGEPFIKKHHDSIFACDDNQPKKEVIGDLTRAIEGLTEVLRVYKDPAVNRNFKKDHNGYSHYSLNSKKKYPVWYRQDKTGNRIYLSPACISRTACYNTIPDILQKHGGYDECKNYDNICDACNLFGMVGENAALGSKIRFSDVKLTENSKKKIYYDTIITLDELSSPKPAAVEFYTKRPNENIPIWNYDDCGSDNRSVEILGRKFYWHSENHKKYYMKRIKENKRNTTIRAVSKDIEFQFKIYYEKITEDELQKLLWILTIGENEIGGKMCHKLGGAKPLGFGSVKITVDKVKERKFTFNNGTIERKSIDLDDTYVNTLIENTHFSGKAYDEFIKITDFEYMKKEKVSYPFGEILDNKTNNKNGKGGHVWFKLNRIDGDNEINKKIRHTLSFKNPKLPQLQQDKNK